MLHLSIILPFSFISSRSVTHGLNRASVIKMSRDWEQNFTSIVKETESNLAKVRQRLDGSRHSHTGPSSNHLLSTFPAKSSTLSRGYASSLFSRSDYPSLSDWHPSAGYQSPFTHGVSSEGESLPSSSTESPAMVALLTEKLDSQAKTIQALSRHVDALERERDRSQTHLRRLDQELSSISHRLQEGGVHLETERKMEGWKREVMLQLGDLQSQVMAHRRSASDGSHGDDALNSLTREVHDFKRQVQEDLALCRREIESLNTRLMRHEIDIGNNQADAKDLSRRVDRLDRTVAGVSESQRSHSRELNHTIQGRQTKDQEILQLRSEMSRLISTVERLENDLPTGSQRETIEQLNSSPKFSDLPAGLHRTANGKLSPRLNSSHQNTTAAVSSSSRLTTSKDTSRRKTANGRKVSKHPRPPVQTTQQLSDSDELDDSASLSLASSDSDDLSLPPHYARNVPRNIHSTYAKEEESSDAFSELTSALIDHDPTLDLVDLASTPSISSIELDADLL